VNQYDFQHITMTYASLVALIILGDDLSGVDRHGIIETLKYLKRDDGSFSPYSNEKGSDLRFLYSACAICYILNDWSAMDIPKATEFILSCIVSFRFSNLNSLMMVLLEIPL
jgi:geranylgeranyl transferase type-1 subunit beta